jgi:hypothetical protein
MTTRKCSRCKQTKNLNKFVKDKTRKKGHRKICKSCRNVYLRIWGSNNKNKVKEYHKKYNNSDKKKLSTKRYYERHKEEIKLKQKIDRIKNPEKHYRWYKRYYESHKTEIYKDVENNREKYKAYIASWKKSENGKISGEDLHKGFHIGHIIPLSKGGEHRIENIQLLTPRENMKKGTKCN